MDVAPFAAMRPAAMSRPQVGIERLPARRMSNEPRESMNCKSCRKRKIKCNRLRPACEACQVFQCPCVYDAVPKKRGPKTDVLEALLKRVDGLEAKLKEQNQSEKSPDTDEPTSARLENADDSTDQTVDQDSADIGARRRSSDRPKTSDSTSRALGTLDPPADAPLSPSVQEDALLDLYFNRFHSKPYHILDESSVRQRLQLNQLPRYLTDAIYALSARYSDHPSGYQSALKLSKQYALRSRKDIDVDEPSIDAMQALLLLVLAFTSIGSGRKAYMLMTSAVGMAMALELHREADPHARITAVERELRRRLFWTCYLLDRFMACGSKRPCLINDKTVMIRLPSWISHTSHVPIEGDFFQGGSNYQLLQGNVRKSQGSMGILIDITRILGVTNRYLAAGGVKGDSHFPWHSLSNLSKIRHELDIWVSSIENVFSSLDGLFGQPDSPVLVLSKLIYHLIHCLIYRPFLPIDLSELTGTGQHQSWQIEATSMCFMHANAIGELVELGKSPCIEWPGFVGYCVATAGTVHVHGAHYNKNSSEGRTGVFAASAEFLSREIQQLCELRYSWASVQHQRETLQRICTAHAELVKSLADHPMRYSPVFHLEDFFDRYANIGGVGGQTFTFDAAYLSLFDVTVEFGPSHDTAPEQTQASSNQTIEATSTQKRPSLKRKATSISGRKWSDAKDATSSQHRATAPSFENVSGPSEEHQQEHVFSAGPNPPEITHISGNSDQHIDYTAHHTDRMETPMDHGSVGSLTLAAGLGPQSQQTPALNGATPTLTAATATFSPNFHFAAVPAAPQNDPNHLGVTQYDPMFGGVPTNAFSSPAAWHGEEDRGDNNNKTKTPTLALATTTTTEPGQDEQETPGTGTGDEHDPFLSLLEQLAENEQWQGNELDAFLAGAQG